MLSWANNADNTVVREVSLLTAGQKQARALISNGARIAAIYPPVETSVPLPPTLLPMAAKEKVDCKIMYEQETRTSHTPTSDGPTQVR